MTKVTLSGRPPEQDVPGAPAPIDPATGMHRDYWVLSEEDRAKGFIRPVRFKYVHKSCGAVTRMAPILAETYARDPTFYGATVCVGCKKQLPVAELLWVGTQDEAGSCGGRTDLVFQ